MNDLGWKLARLRVMTPGEIAHRARVALRDAVAPPSYTRWTPERAFEHLFEGDEHEVLRSSLLAKLVRVVDGAAFESEIAAARALMEGRWTLFGAPVRLDHPPRWNASPRTGAAWPDAPSASLDYHDTSIAGDPKDTWELGRLTVLPTLALAARATGDRAFADRAVAWLDDFTARNPLGRGIHHTSGIEQAVRVLNVTWTLALLGDRADDVKLAPCLGILAQQALCCRDHLSLGSSANNHLIAEYAAMTVLGSIFPAARDAQGLRDRGLRGLEKETLRQFAPDGVLCEQAFGYLPLVWELLLLAIVAAEAAGAPVSNAVRARLGASLEFARVIRLEGGSWPRVGDEDDGRILLAGESASRLDRVGNALAAWLGADAFDSAETALALLLFGNARPARREHDGVTVTADYTVWRDRDVVVTFDHGPLGLEPLAAHGHADALSVTIHRGRDAVVVDPGTFAYHADPDARDRCRSTPAHSTVHFGGASQAQMRGPFLWQGFTRCRPEPVGDAAHADAARDAGRADASRVDARGDTADAAGWSCEWSGREWHRRSVSVAGGAIEIRDRARPVGDAHVVFALAPGARVELSGARAGYAADSTRSLASMEAHRAVVTSGGTRSTFESEGLAEWKIEPGEVAPRYGVRIAAPRLVAAMIGERSRVSITLGDA
ncbi:MAG: alginate lyase family protein [Candidatus Eisenbacteria bacterium]|nr:alginate lyase family protein [Candidatus Eisenbacteria bacterium]